MFMTKLKTSLSYQLDGEIRYLEDFFAAKKRVFLYGGTGEAKQILEISAAAIKECHSCNHNYANKGKMCFLHCFLFLLLISTIARVLQLLWCCVVLQLLYCHTIKSTDSRCGDNWSNRSMPWVRDSREE